MQVIFDHATFGLQHIAHLWDTSRRVLAAALLLQHGVLTLSGRRGLPRVQELQYRLIVMPARFDLMTRVWYCEGRCPPFLRQILRILGRHAASTVEPARYERHAIVSTKSWDQYVSQLVK